MIHRKEYNASGLYFISDLLRDVIYSLRRLCVCVNESQVDSKDFDFCIGLLN